MVRNNELRQQIDEAYRAQDAKRGELKARAPVQMDDRRYPCLTPHEAYLVRIFEKIPAIKAIRERTNVSLREAKEMVDSYEAEHVKKQGANW